MRRMLATCTVAFCSTVNAAAEITDYEPEYSAFLINKSSINDACLDSPRISMDSYHNGHCADYIVSKRNEALATKQLEPEDCQDLALYNGFGAPELNMQVSLTGGNGAIVQFFGKVMEGEASKFIVYNAQTSSNAIIRYTDSTHIFNGVSIGGAVLGYGKVEGSSTVALVSGRKTQIPIIEAYCLQ